MMHTSDHTEPNYNCGYNCCRCCPRQTCICHGGNNAPDYYDRYFRYTYQFVDPHMFDLPDFLNINPYDKVRRLPDDFIWPNKFDLGI